MKNIIELDTEIAIFMGATTWNSSKEGVIYNLPNHIPSYVAKELKYHSSWDWLMPAIKKMLTTLKNANHKDREMLEWTNLRIGQLERAVWNYMYNDLEIVDVAKELVELIEWYNSHVNKK